MEYRKEYNRESLIGTEYEYLLHEVDDLYDEDCVKQNWCIVMKKGTLLIIIKSNVPSNYWTNSCELEILQLYLTSSKINYIDNQ